LFCVCSCFFFFKQKTAYEMRISDWSSDVCSSDLTAEHIIKQVAALPYRIDPDGAARILLITSRETRRWIIPKGNPIRGLEAHQAAAREAFEEAGISGIACPAAIGQYTYEKRKRNGNRHLLVDVYPLEIGRASRGGRVCQSVEISGVAFSL